MNKLIFRKFSFDILNFFLIASFSITFIVWIIQAVNLLDLVSDDGHSLNVYFYYVSLNLPKIFSKIIIFVFFISVFYVINKYNNSNELLVFWNNGIQKINFQDGTYIEKEYKYGDQINSIQKPINVLKMKIFTPLIIGCLSLRIAKIDGLLE